MTHRVLVLPYRVLSGAARAAFVDELARRGLVHPDTLELAWAEEDPPGSLAARIDAFSPDVLVVGGTTQSLKARDIAPEVPIIAWGVASEVAGRRPTRMTGVTLAPDIDARRLRLFQRLVPTLKLLGLAYDDSYPPGRLALGRTQRAADELGLTARVYEVRRPEELAPAIAAMAADRVDGVQIMNSPILGRDDMARACLEHRVPLMAYDWTTRAGGLASITPDFRDVARRFAAQVARLAQGVSIDEIAMERHTAFWTAVNLSTARALGLEVPASVLAEANELVR